MKRNGKFKIYTILVILSVKFSYFTCIIHNYDLPLFNDDTLKKDDIYHEGFASTNLFIPRHVWIATRNISDEKPQHAGPLIRRNPQWKFHYYGNDEKDSFMITHFRNTSLLWAYMILNPVIGCSRPEIWRLAILYKYGGLYMDDDSTFEEPLDNIIRPGDKFIAGKEPYTFDDRCYRDDYPLSNYSMTKRFGSRNQQDLIGGRFLFNWALFSAPGHPVVLRSLEHIVQLLKLEYLGDSAVKMHTSDHRGKLLMCTTTFPITHSVHELLLEAGMGLSSEDKNQITELGIRIGDEYFREYGARMKAWFNDHRPDHWVKTIQKYRAPYLLSYGTPPPGLYEGRTIQAIGHREIFLVRNGTRHSFPNIETFTLMGFRLEDVRLLPIPIGESIPLGSALKPVSQ